MVFERLHNVNNKKNVVCKDLKMKEKSFGLLYLKN